MTCVVFGGSGQIGRFLLPELRARGIAVAAFSRRPRATENGTVWMQGRLPDAVPVLPPGVAAIVCLGPLDHFAHWLQHAPLAGAPRIVAMSSMSAESKRHSPDPAERELAARLRESERRLVARCVELGSTCTILRATLIYGAGTDRSLTPLARIGLRWRVFPLPRGTGLRQPVHADDLALAVLAALERAHGPACIVPVGGGERLSATAMFERVRASLSRRTLPLPLPRFVLRCITSITGRGGGAVARLDEDLLADNTELVRLLGVHPRPFEPQGSQWGESRARPGSGVRHNHH